MGRRGPPPTPTPVLKLRGSWRANEREGEPVPATGTPEIPASLAEHPELWAEVLRLIEDSGVVVSRPDAAQLERYCRYLIRWRRCEAEIDKLTAASIMGVMLKEESRGVLRHLLAESHRCDETLKRSEQQFCLTPAARASAGMAIAKHVIEPKGIEAFARKRG